MGSLSNPVARRQTTENQSAISVAAIDTTIKRGRPSTGMALSQRQRDLRYRAKKRFLLAALQMRECGLDPREVLRESLQ